MIPNLVNKFQMSCLRGTLVFEIKSNVWHKDVETWVKLYPLAVGAKKNNHSTNTRYNKTREQNIAQHQVLKKKRFTWG